MRGRTRAHTRMYARTHTHIRARAQTRTHVRARAQARTPNARPPEHVVVNTLSHACSAAVQVENLAAFVVDSCLFNLLDEVSFGEEELR